jgi:hypothetical protein
MIDINLYAKRRRTSIFDIIKYKKLTTYTEFRNFCVAHRVMPPGEDVFDAVFKAVVDEAKEKHNEEIITKVNVVTKTDVENIVEEIDYASMTKKQLMEELDKQQISYTKSLSKKQLLQIILQ